MDAMQAVTREYVMSVLGRVMNTAESAERAYRGLTRCQTIVTNMEADDPKLDAALETWGAHAHVLRTLLLELSSLHAELFHLLEPRVIVFRAAEKMTDYWLWTSGSTNVRPVTAAMLQEVLSCRVGPEINMPETGL